MGHLDPVFLAEWTCKLHLYVPVAEAHAIEGLTKTNKNLLKIKPYLGTVVIVIYPC